MKVLVTGGCGFLGSNIAADCLGAGADVTVVDALYRQGAERNLAWLSGQAGGGRLFHCRCDLADAAAVEEVFRTRGPFDYVCHVGGQVAMTDSLRDPRRDLLSNIVGTFNVLECVRNLCRDGVLVYSSTNKVYGDLLWVRTVETETRYTVPDYPNGFDETLPLDLATPYGCSKGAADQYVREWSRSYGLKTVVFRHSSIYGGRQFASYDQGWIGWFCAKALEQRRAMATNAAIQPFTISGSGKQVRDVLHAGDLVRLYRIVYEKADSVAGEIFNIGGGMENSLSLRELFALLEEQLRLPRPLVWSPQARRQSDQDFFVSDNSKATRLLGWRPSIAKEEGLRLMLEWQSRVL